MKKNLILFGVAVLLVCVGLSGCNELGVDGLTDEEKIIGSWKGELTYEDVTAILSYTFLSDKTFFLHLTAQDETITRNSGNWKILDNKLVMTVEGEMVTMDYIFSNNDKTLTITDPNNHVYKLTKE